MGHMARRHGRGVRRALLRGAARPGRPLPLLPSCVEGLIPGTTTGASPRFGCGCRPTRAAARTAYQPLFDHHAGLRAFARPPHSWPEAPLFEQLAGRRRASSRAGDLEKVDRTAPASALRRTDPEGRNQDFDRCVAAMRRSGPWSGRPRRRSPRWLNRLEERCWTAPASPSTIAAQILAGEETDAATFYTGVRSRRPDDRLCRRRTTPGAT